MLCQEGFCGSGGDFQNLKPWEMQLLMLFLLGECNCVTVWCEVLLYSEVNQLCVYTRTEGPGTASSEPLLPS